MATRAPIRPGEILRDDFMHAFHISAYKLAKDLNVTTNRITGIIRGERALTADTALRLARYFGTTPDFWINLEGHYRLQLAKREFQKEIEREVPERAGVAA